MSKTQKMYLGDTLIGKQYLGSDLIIERATIEEGAPAPPYASDLVRWFDAEYPGDVSGSEWKDWSNTITTASVDSSEISYVSGTPNYYSKTNTLTSYGIQATPSPITGSQNNTMIAWVRPSAIKDASICIIGDRSNNFESILLRFDNSPAALRVEFAGAGKTSSTLTYSTGTWYQAAVTLDGTRPADCTMYLNTSSDDCGTNTTTLDIQSTLCNATIGNQQYLGDIAVWLIYNRALSATEIEEVFDFYKGRYGY